MGQWLPALLFFPGSIPSTVHFNSFLRPFVTPYTETDLLASAKHAKYLLELNALSLMFMFYLYRNNAILNK